MHAADGIVVALAADEPDQFDIRMAGEQPDQLATDIPGRPDDPDPDAARPAGRVDTALASGGRTRSADSPGSAATAVIVA